MKSLTRSIISDDTIINKIYVFRNEKVMLDSDLAELYGVTTSRLNEQVKRNKGRFPEDFMFQINEEEFKNLISQNATSSWGGKRKRPFAFTEQGVAMLSSVLSSDRAIQVNIQIIRIYTKMRQFLLTNKDILLKIEQLEKRTDSHDEKIHLIFEYLKKLLQPEVKPRVKIGYKIKE